MLLRERRGQRNRCECQSFPVSVFAEGNDLRCSPLRQCRYLFVCVWMCHPVKKHSYLHVLLLWFFFFVSNDPPTSTSNGKVYVSEVKMRNAARKMYDAARKQGKTAALVATKWVQNLFNTFSSGSRFGFFGSITVSRLPLETGTGHISFTFQQAWYFKSKYGLKYTNSTHNLMCVSFRRHFHNLRQCLHLLRHQSLQYFINNSNIS